MVQRVATVAFEGIEARAVDVQVQLAPGLPAFNIVGLPDKAVSEAKERVRAALIASGLALPARRITINLAPADLPKEGSHYDLPIALGLMAAIGALPHDAIAGFTVLGELGLDGDQAQPGAEWILIRVLDYYPRSHDFGVEQDDPSRVSSVCPAGQGHLQAPPSRGDRLAGLADVRRQHRITGKDGVERHLPQVDRRERPEWHLPDLGVGLVHDHPCRHVLGGKRVWCRGFRAELDPQSHRGDEKGDSPTRPRGRLQPDHLSESTERRPAWEVGWPW